MATIEERLAVLEHTVKIQDSDTSDLIALFKEQREADAVRWEKMDKRMDKFEGLITKYRGFLGGIFFTISALWTVGLIALKFFWDKH